MVAGIEAQNVTSIRLHEKLGFERVGHLKEVGTKFGKWLDLAFLQLTLDSRLDPDGGRTFVSAIGIVTADVGDFGSKNGLASNRD